MRLISFQRWDFFSLRLLRNGKIEGARAWALPYIRGSAMVYS